MPGITARVKPQLRREKQNLSNLRHDANAISLKDLDNLSHEELEGIRKIRKRRKTPFLDELKVRQRPNWNTKR